MSLKNNTTSLQELLEAINTLPNTEDLDSLLTEQEDIIDQLSSTLGRRETEDEDDQVMSNRERIQANNTDLRECIEAAENLLEVTGTPYNGEYVITPQTEGQTLPTKEKILLEDITIMAIPYAEVANNSGGLTATIG